MLRTEAIRVVTKMTEANKTDKEQALYIMNAENIEPTYENTVKYIYKVRNIRRQNGISKADRVPTLRSGGIARWLATKSI